MKLLAMTYNIRSGRNLDNQLDIRFAAGVIAVERPDFCALNEVRSGTSDVGPVNQAEQLGELTGMHWAFGRSIDVMGGEYGNALLSRHPIVAHSVIHIPDPARPEGKHLEHRSILRCVLEIEGRKLTVLVSHFGLNACEQVEAVRAAVAAVRAEENPVVLMGDFNMTPDNERMRPLFDELCDAAGGADQPRTYPSDRPTEKIDYLFTRGLPAAGLRSVDTQMSDHRPLLATLGG